MQYSTVAVTIRVELRTDEGARGAGGCLGQGDELAIREGRVDPVDLETCGWRELELAEGYGGILDAADDHPVHRGGVRFGRRLHRNDQIHSKVGRNLIDFT